ncbi:MAG: amidohydrolase family protein [Desulfomonile tiedjei]|nr:amidohydrolase family protein [Desulfomonile tiedjei]
MRKRVHRAGWILVKPGVWIENGMVEVVDGGIAQIGKSRAGAEIIDHGPGVIMPALINAHTHLSLSALHGRLDTGKGFVNWVQELITARSGLSAEEISSAAARAAQGIKDSGTGLVAEVGPAEPGATAMRANGLEGIVFEEVLGNSCEQRALPRDENGLTFSFAGHGLHTTAPNVLRSLKSATLEQNRIFSIHLAESDAETEFLECGNGPWAELLDSRGIDFAHWGIGGERPVHRAVRLGLLGPGTLAVHLLQVDDAEMAVLADTRTAVCVCPRSNFLLHGQLPDIQALLAAGLAPALGTDSAASAWSLSLFDEMAFVSERYPGLSPDRLLAFATVNAAKALDKPDMGTVEPGQRAYLIYVDIAAGSGQEAALQLVAGRPDRVEWL